MMPEFFVEHENGKQDIYTSTRCRGGCDSGWDFKFEFNVAIDDCNSGTPPLKKIAMYLNPERWAAFRAYVDETIRQLELEVYHNPSPAPRPPASAEGGAA